jgi:hypothetical protein
LAKIEQETQRRLEYLTLKRNVFKEDDAYKTEKSLLFSKMVKNIKGP